MTFQPKPNTGSLFVNKKKVAGDNKPDRTGTVNVGGTMMQIAGWIKKQKDGTPYLSLSIKPVQPHTPQANGYQKPQAPMNSDDWQNGEDAPF